MSRGEVPALIGSIACALVVALGSASPAAAQPVQPVFTHTGLDGRLIGLTTDVRIETWKPIAALAYGLRSGRLRYRAGLELKRGVELPLIGTRLGDPSVALTDWPESPVLGREGQRGVQVGWRLGPTRVSAFTGSLWPLHRKRTQEGTLDVSYIRLDTSRAFDLPFELQAHASSQTLIGMALDAGPAEQVFRATTRSLSLTLGDFRVSGRWGMLSNGAQLAGFEFTTGVRGVPHILRGHQFWNLTLRRTFRMHESSIPIELPVPVPPVLKRLLPESLPVLLEGTLFLQAGGATRGDPSGSAVHQQLAGSTSTGMSFSWGMLLSYSIHNLRVEADLIIPQSGEVQFHWKF